MSWTKVLFINLLVILLGLLLLEVGTRVTMTVRSCLSAEQCNTKPITSLAVSVKSNQTTRYIGLSRPDSELGYVPSENFHAVIQEDGWDGATASIDANGFRSNDNDIPLDRKNKILALGDSFTFGDQVSNHDTWAACLERKTGRQVDNAGVFGYGTALALKRGIRIAAADNYDVVILSVLVGHDYSRDRYIYRIGFARPALTSTNGKISWSDVPDPKVPGTRYNPKINRGLLALHQHSMVASYLINYSEFISESLMIQDKLTVEHPNAASIEEIIGWTIDELPKIKANRKIYLLQYRKKLNSEKVVQERQFLLKALSKKGIEYVDTYSLFNERDPSEYWKGHHTPLGNAVVCDAIASKLGSP